MNNTFSNFPDPSEETYTPDEAKAAAEATPAGDAALLSADGLTFSETRRAFSRIGVAYLVLVVALLAVSYVAQFAVYFFAPRLLNTWWINWLFSLLPLYGAALPLAWLVLRRIPTAPHNTDCTIGRLTEEKPSFGFGHFLLLLVIAFGSMSAGGIVGNIIMSILSAIMNYDYANALVSMVSESPVWATFIGTCLCAPLGEELIFRKLLIDRTRRFGDLPSILLSGLLFGLFHGNLFQFFYAALVGMLLAYVYTRTGKYSWCVAMHAAINFMGSIVMPNLANLLPEDVMTFTSPVQPLIYLFIVIWQYGTLIAGIVLFCIFFSHRKLSRGTAPLPRQNGLSLVCLNPGMIACLLVMLLLLGINLIPVR